MDKIQYQPQGLWHSYDFLVNKHFWDKKGYSASIAIRESNLLELTKVMDESGIFYWLQGKTLLGIVNHSKLLEDHDDDLGMWIKDYDSLINNIKPSLEKIGFSLIRDEGGIVSFVRNYRYIDICIFSENKQGTCGYAEKKFPIQFYLKFMSITWRAHTFNIPALAQSLLTYMYKKPLIKNSKLLGTIKKIFKFFLNKENKRLQIFAFKKKLLAWCSSKPLARSFIFKAVGRPFGFKQLTLSEEDFQNLYIEPNDSYNWRWRFRHLGLVTNNGAIRKVGDIISYLSDSNIRKKIEVNLDETNTEQLFLEPLNLDMDFWWGGNNYFWYCVKYQFRHNVLSYLDAKKYIDSISNPKLYTAQYYESLTEMTESEMNEFLKEAPIEIIDNAVVSGKHRVFAMIGRLSEGKKYIPINALTLQNN